jgi:hypothetical protein
VAEQQMNPAADFVAELGPLQKLGEQTRWDALRAVAYVHGQRPETPATIREAAELVFALGLAEMPETPTHVAGPINVACPQCAVPAGRRCISTTSGDDLGAHHRGRQRRAAEAAAAKTETCHKDSIEKETRRD